jgi:hypothetical protein
MPFSMFLIQSLGRIVDEHSTRLYLEIRLQIVTLAAKLYSSWQL